MQYLKQQYKEVGRFLGRDIRWILLGVTTVFVLVIIITHMAFMKNQAQLMDMIAVIQEELGDIASEEGALMARDLFLNNIRACLIGVVSGFIPFLFLPAFTLFINAAVLGGLGAMYQINGMSVFGMYIYGILPHGLFEFPAILISMAMGIYLCYCLVKRICEGRYNRGIVKKALADILRTFMMVIVPLLVVAALIESYLTPVLIDHFMV